ncbi:MAG: cation diffusion facilitator family transporter, partial [Alphaproteobacteria bacterium]
PRHVAQAPLAIAVSLLAMVLTFFLVAYQRRVVRQTGSVAISADSLHYAGDFFLNAGVILAVVVNGLFGVVLVDPLMALAIAGFLGWNAAVLARAAVDMLMDKEWPAEERERILGVILQNPAVAGVHELRTRTSGTDGFIQFHIALDPAMTLAAAHTVADEVEGVLGELYPQAEILIHMDPVGLAEHEQDTKY